MLTDRSVFNQVSILKAVEGTLEQELLNYFL